MTTGSCSNVANIPLKHCGIGNEHELQMRNKAVVEPFKSHCVLGYVYISASLRVTVPNTTHGCTMTTLYPTHDPTVY